MDQVMSFNDIMLQKARYFITRCKNELKWEDLSRDVVMDIGCGNSFHCTRALFETFKEVGCVLAIDKRSDVMTNEICEDTFLKAFFRYSIVQFHDVDILDSNGLERYKGLINKIVCKDTLQQIDDKVTAFQNMYDLLKPGGSAWILFCLTNPVGSWQLRISEHENWRQYRRKVPLSFYDGNLEKDYYQNLLEKFGFLVVLSEIKFFKLVFINEECCLGELMPIGLALLDIPPERMAEFKEESVKIFKEMIGHKGDGPLFYHASELLLLVIKPHNIHEKHSNFIGNYF